MADENDWQYIPLGELTENFDALRVPVKESERKSGPYPYYGASGIVDWVDSYILDGEYLLVAEDGENLRTQKTSIAFIARGRIWINNHAHVVQANHKADTQFLMYALSQAEVSAYLTGSTMPKLTQNNLNRVPILTPPLCKQRAIAHILGTLDDKIELNRKMNETLDEIARTLFTSWFVNFDPVRAKAEGRRPEGMGAETAALFPDRFVDSELGLVPEGWVVGRISDLVQILKHTINPGLFPDERFDHYSIPAFDNGRTPVTELGANIKSNKTSVDQHTILVSKLNPRIPRIWLPDLTSERRSICSTEFIVTSSLQPSTRPFVYALLTSGPFTSQFAAMVTGTTGSHQRVRPESMLAMPILLPSNCLIASFSEIAEPLFDLIATNRHEAVTLSRIRDTVLPQLLSGTLHTLEVRRHMGSAVGA